MIKKYARVESRVVVELFETDQDIVELFHPDLHWVLATDGVAVGDLYDGIHFSKSVIASGKTKETLIADVAAHRYHIETAGIVVGGYRINTEREAQAKLNAAFVSLQNGLITTTDWKADDGAWVTVDLAGLKPIATAVAQHVAACYTTEKAHQTAIAALKTQKQIDDYDVTTGWPS